MIHSETIGKVMDALRQAQLEFDPVLKDTRNPLYNSKYAELSGVIAATQPALAKNNLVVSQLAISDLEHQGSGVTTMLVHTSGEFIASDFLLPAVGQGKGNTIRHDAQTACGAVTYARRYSYLSVLGIAAQDDDGNQASGRVTPEYRDLEPQQNFPIATLYTPPAAFIPPAAPAVVPETTSAAVPDNGSLPTETELKDYREKFRKLGDDLSAGGQLKSSKGRPINRKLLFFLLGITGAKEAKTITAAQWSNFFERVDHVKGLENGLVGLAKLVNKANGVEEKK